VSDLIDPMAAIWEAAGDVGLSPNGELSHFRFGCPVSTGHGRSVTAIEGADRRPVLHCDSDCAPEQIADALGLGRSILQPPETNHKGHLGNGARRKHDGERSTALVLPSPAEPMRVARVLVQEQFTDPGSGEGALVHWRGAWWEWRRTRWAEIESRAIQATVWTFTENAVYLDAEDEQREWAPNRHKVTNVIEALAAAVHLPRAVPSPSWLDGRETGTLVSCTNGLLDVSTRELLPHSSRYFGQVAVPFAYDPDARHAPEWTTFLNSLWPDDAESQYALAEWFGYVLSGSTAMQKILLLVGPTRGGKGVIARALAALVGKENVAGPTLSSLGGEFGLAPLLGMPLAIVSDARLGTRDSSTVVERLLSVSGEDRLTVNIKYREQWSGTLPSRFMLLSNELPQLGDASAAIAGRFITLLLSRSWLGHEDRDLERRIQAELPAILNWSLDGLARLEAAGTFTTPPAADDAYRALVDLASPVKAFVRDRCMVAMEHRVGVDDLYRAWKAWAEDNGHGRKTKQTFGRDLRAAVPRLRVVQHGGHDERIRVYEGIGLTGPEPDDPQGRLA
jgi:putative DNA primase/helicase